MRNTIIIAAITLLLGFGIGYSLNAPTVSHNAPESKADEPLYWVAPMDPSYRRDKPGKSPMGMDLVPVYPGGETGADTNALTLDPAVINNIGVRTDTARLMDLPREISTVGFVTPDEDLTAHVHVRSAGWAEKLHRKAVGEKVSKGEVMFELYSPELVNAQHEFLQALRLQKQNLISASKDRLIALGMTKAQIADVRQNRKPQQHINVRAPQDGIILSLNIGEGMYVTPSTTVFSLADLSNIWVKVDVFESQSDWVVKGQKATMHLPYMPGEAWEGMVDYIYPIVNSASRTVQARLKFPNPKGTLKPNMYGEVQIEASPHRNVLAIPREALIRTGKTDRVILALGQGRFRPAEVVAGMESGDYIEIMDGLTDGEEIVTSGQFLLDSEASTNSAFLRMLGTESDNSPAEEPVHRTSGTLNHITEDGMLNISHGPIETMNMMAMTMNFKVADIVDISALDPGDAIDFELKRGDGPMFVITRITKR